MSPSSSALCREKVWRPIAILAFVLAATILLAACGSSSNSSSSSSSSSSSGSSSAGTGTGSTKVAKKHIAYVEIFLAAPIEKRINTAFTEAAQHVGWTVSTTDAKGLGQTVTQQFQAAIESKADAIVLGSVEPSLVMPQLKAANEAKIPLVAIAGESHTTPLVPAVYTENDVELSKPLAEQMCKEVKPGSEVALLRFDLFYSGKQRGDTLTKAAQQCGLKVVADPQTEQTFSDSEKKTAAVLNAHPNLAAIVPVYDTFTAGATQAIKTAGKASQVKIYSYYADTINAPLMRANKNIVGLTDCDCVKEAGFAVEQLLSHFTTGAKLAPTLPPNYLTYAVVTQSNIPPEGQDGPVSISGTLEPYYKQWDAKYKYEG